MILSRPSSIALRWRLRHSSSAMSPNRPRRMAIGDRSFSEIGVHRGRADADQHGVIMGVEAFGELRTLTEA